MNDPKNKTNRISTAIAISIGVVVAILVQQFMFTTPSFDKVLMKTASNLNKECPMMVDQETRLDNAIALSNDVFQYNYTLVNIRKDSIDLEAFNNYMKPMLVNNVKTSPDLKVFRDHNITLAYQYKDNDGAFVTKIEITSQQYWSNKQ
nr:hypothetical protein [uncultured Carboxylicivirga sp.]